MLRLQSSIEYFFTLRWALLTISILVIAAYALGLFNPHQISGPKCLLEAGFSCLNFSITQSGLLTLDVEQATTSINVTSYNCSASANVKLYTLAPRNQVAMRIGSDHTFQMQCYDANGANATIQSGNYYSGTIGIGYTDTVKGYPHVMYGKIIVQAS